VLVTKLQFPTEYGLFIAANLLDLFLTMAFITYGAGEANPAARSILLHMGKTGFVVYKVLLMLVVIGLTEAVSRKRRTAARILIWFGTLALWAVAVHSGIRFFTYMQNPGG
jgi:hypothetical protein